MTDVPPIETLGGGDAPELRVLSQAIGWTHTDDDWRTILEVGRVFGHRASDGGFLSSGALFEYGPSLASIGMILVTPASRGRGRAFGSRGNTGRRRYAEPALAWRTGADWMADSGPGSASSISTRAGCAVTMSGTTLPSSHGCSCPVQ